MTAFDRLHEVKAGKKNVGGAERAVRAVVGPSILLVGIAALGSFVTLASGFAGTAIAVILALGGLRMSQTAITQRCYMNALLGRDTCRLDPAPSRGSSDAEI